MELVQKEQQHVISHFVSFWGNDGVEGGGGNEFQHLPRSTDFICERDYPGASAKLKIKQLFIPPSNHWGPFSRRVSSNFLVYEFHQNRTNQTGYFEFLLLVP